MLHSATERLSPLSPTTFHLPPISVPRLLFTSPTLPLFFQCALRGKATEGDRHETNPKQLQRMKEAGEGAINKEHSGAVQG